MDIVFMTLVRTLLLGLCASIPLATYIKEKNDFNQGINQDVEEGTISGVTKLDYNTYMLKVILKASNQEVKTVVSYNISSMLNSTPKVGQEIKLIKIENGEYINNYKHKSNKIKLIVACVVMLFFIVLSTILHVNK